MNQAEHLRRRGLIKLDCAIHPANSFKDTKNAECVDVAGKQRLLIGCANETLGSQIKNAVGSAPVNSIDNVTIFQKLKIYNFYILVYAEFLKSPEIWSRISANSTNDFMSFFKHQLR